MKPTDTTNQTEVSDPWREATDACLEAANLYADTMQACWMASAEAMLGTMQSGLQASSSTVREASETTPSTRDASDAVSEIAASVDRRVRSLTAAPGNTAASWYRPPVENPLLSMVDDAMKPWRTMIPDYSGHPQHLSEADLFTPKGAAEIMAAYQSGSGFSMAHISFPDEKSVSVTLPAPWAMLTKT